MPLSVITIDSVLLNVYLPIMRDEIRPDSHRVNWAKRDGKIMLWENGLYTAVLRGIAWDDMLVYGSFSISDQFLEQTPEQFSRHLSHQLNTFTKEFAREWIRHCIPQ